MVNRRLTRLFLRWCVLLSGLALVACGRAYSPGYGPAPVIYGNQARGHPRSYVPPTQSSVPSWVDRERVELLRPRPHTGTVRVAQGDTLYRISRRYGVAVDGLIRLNKLAAPYDLIPGQTMVLPRPKTHLVRKGETIYGLARSYDVSTQALVRANRISPPYRLSVGQKINIPTSAAPDISATATRPAITSVRKLPPPRLAVSRPSVRNAAPPRRSGRGFLWPVRGRVLIAFGVRSNGLRNDGINIAAKKGTPVRAAENGVVAYTGNQLRGFGNLILLKHAGGWTTAYAHNATLVVRTGDRVRRGQMIARVGKTGNVSRSQLHFELRRGDAAVDPAKHLTVRTASKRLSRALARAGRRDPG